MTLLALVLLALAAPSAAAQVPPEKAEPTLEVLVEAHEPPLPPGEPLALEVELRLTVPPPVLDEPIVVDLTTQAPHGWIVDVQPRELTLRAPASAEGQTLLGYATLLAQPQPGAEAGSFGDVAVLATTRESTLLRPTSSYGTSRLTVDYQYAFHVSDGMRHVDGVVDESVAARIFASVTANADAGVEAEVLRAPVGCHATAAPGPVEPYVVRGASTVVVETPIDIYCERGFQSGEVEVRLRLTLRPSGLLLPPEKLPAEVVTISVFGGSLDEPPEVWGEPVLEAPGAPAAGALGAAALAALVAARARRRA